MQAKLCGSPPSTAKSADSQYFGYFLEHGREIIRTCCVVLAVFHSVPQSKNTAERESDGLVQAFLLFR
ncbi:MAG: hypothetical protein KBT28_12155 [Bacteroidales bacterium]|nr:hypothetical protein [Candidatus Colimorpha merdihippi]